MPNKKETLIARQENEVYLYHAIAHWRPDRPRRWLAKYGCLPADGKGCVVERYRRIRKEAEAMCARPRVYRLQGLSSHRLLLMLTD
ncbi:hypothetical protein [Aeromonas jandaei]|uniref:hypothetical protein n=1 Tax=Aeromonas jandaei TaxID=650 RepID=UPI0038D0A1C8